MCLAFFISLWLLLDGDQEMLQNGQVSALPAFFPTALSGNVAAPRHEAETGPNRCTRAGSRRRGGLKTGLSRDVSDVPWGVRGGEWRRGGERARNVEGIPSSQERMQGSLRC